MNGTLLVSRKTYSLLKQRAVTEWKETPYELDSIKMPKDFELRLVNADMDLNSITQAFPELQIGWTAQNQVINAGLRIVSSRDGCTDIAWHSSDLRMAFIFKSHAPTPNIICVQSIEDLKRELD